jgi:hypothetical protein
VISNILFINYSEHFSKYQFVLSSLSQNSRLTVAAITILYFMSDGLLKIKMKLEAPKEVKQYLLGGFALHSLNLECYYWSQFVLDTD